MAAPIDDLLHRVNNLLGTIQVQVAAAKAVGTAEALEQALRLIAAAADRTHGEVQRFRRGGSAGVTDPAAS